MFTPFEARALVAAASVSAPIDLVETTRRMLKRRNASSRRYLFARGGGHVSFHGRGDAVPWHDRSISTYFRELAARRAAPVRGQPLLSSFAASTAK